MTETVYGFVPARKGSQGILNKNLKHLAGKPLVVRAIETLLQTDEIASVILSTDSEEIASLGREAGAQVPFLRPAAMSTPTSPVLSAIHHALGFLQNQNIKLDRLVMVQPTSPFVTSATISSTLKHAQEHDFPLVQTVSPVKDHPYWVRVPAGFQMYPLLANFGSLRRQDLPEVFVLNGAVNIYKVAALEEGELPQFPAYFLIDRIQGFDVDDEADWKIAEALSKTIFSEKENDENN